MLQFVKLFKSISCLFLVAEAFCLQKVVEMLEDMVGSWQEVRKIRSMKQNFITEFVNLLQYWLYDIQFGLVMEKYWPLSVDQCQMQALQFSMHLIRLLSILLRCNGFVWIQNAVDQSSSRSPNSDHDFFWGKFGFGK